MCASIIPCVGAERRDLAGVGLAGTHALVVGRGHQCPPRYALSDRLTAAVRMAAAKGWLLRAVDGP